MISSLSTALFLVVLAHFIVQEGWATGPLDFTITDSFRIRKKQLEDDSFIVAVVLGTRPEAVKLAPVIRALHLEQRIFPVVICTGKHHDCFYTMSTELISNH